jgi:hypothetical protein
MGDAFPKKAGKTGCADYCFLAQAIAFRLFFVRLK